MKDFRSLGIGGITVTGLSNAGQSDGAYSAKIYGGEFTGYDVSAVIGQEGFLPEALNAYSKDTEHAIVKNTWDGTILEYANVKLKTDADLFELAIGSSGQYGGQSYEIYIDSLEGSPVASGTVDNPDWYDFTPKYVRLNNAVSSGIHTIYIKFPRGTAHFSNQTSNMYYFGFLPVGTEIPDGGNADSEFVAKVFGGTFDAEASVQDSAMPFISRSVDKVLYSEMGLTNTKPGTTAVYKAVSLDKAATKLTVRYASDTGYDGQTVDVRIGSSTAEPVAQLVTKGNGWETFTTETIELGHAVEAGEYDIYLTFGGNDGSNQTCKLHWFGFAE